MTKRNLIRNIIAAICIIIAIKTTAQNPDIVIKDFNPDNDGIIWQDELQTGITVKAVNALKQNLEFAVSCLDINGEFTALTLVKNQSPQYGYIDIVTQGKRIINKVDFIGASANPAASSFPIVAINTDEQSTDEFPEDIFSDNPILGEDNPPAATSIQQVMNFSQNYYEACTSNYTIQIPKIVYKGNIVQPMPRQEITEFDKKVRTIRLIWGITPFAGINAPNTTHAPNIYGIKIYLQDTATNIQEENPDDQQQDIIQQGNSIYCNQQADITIYNMAGQKVMQVKNTKQAGLDNLNKGIYIIKAVSKINGHVFVKKISLV